MEIRSLSALEVVWAGLVRQSRCAWIIACFSHRKERSHNDLRFHFGVGGIQMRMNFPTKENLALSVNVYVTHSYAMK